MTTLEAYVELGIPSSTPYEEAKSKYKKLCKKHHPDNNGDAEKFNKILKAWKCLDTPDAWNKQVKKWGHKSLFQLKRRF